MNFRVFLLSHIVIAKGNGALEERLGSEQDAVSGGLKEAVLSVRIPVCEDPNSASAIEASSGICPVGNCC